MSGQATTAAQQTAEAHAAAHAAAGTHAASHAASTHAAENTKSSPTIAATMASPTEARRDVMPARPFSPSMTLIAWVTPVTANTVNRNANACTASGRSAAIITTTGSGI